MLIIGENVGRERKQYMGVLCHCSIFLQPETLPKSINFKKEKKTPLMNYCYMYHHG